MKDRTKKGLLDLLLLLAGTLLLAFAVKCIYEPLDMVTGGFSGLAILIKAVTEHMVPGGIPLGVSSLLLNIPVFLWAFWKKGKTFAGKSFAAMILLSLWLSILPAWNLAGDDMSSVVPLVAVSWDLVSVWCCAPGVLPAEPICWRRCST